MPKLTAELHFDHQVQSVEAAEGETLTIGRRAGHVPPPSIDLADAPDGKTVSRRHGDLLVRDGKWYLRVEGTARNETLIDGQPVPTGDDAPLASGARLTLGKVEVTFWTTSVVSDDQILMTLEGVRLTPVRGQPPRLTLAAGDHEQVVVTIVNHTGRIEWFEIELEGIEPSWYALELDQQNRDPDNPNRARLRSIPLHSTPTADAMTRARIGFKPPRDTLTLANTYTVRINATMVAEPHLRRSVLLNLTILPFPDLAFQLGETRLDGPRAIFPFTLQNLGNAAAQADLRPDGEGLSFAPDPAGYLPGQDIAPNQTVSGGVIARVTYRHWWGVERGYLFQVSAISRADPGTVRLTNAQLICPPRLPQWLQGILHALQGMLAQVITLALILGVAYLVLRPPNIKSFEADNPVIIAGTPVALSWNVEDANAVAIDPPLPTPSATPVTAPTPVPAEEAIPIVKVVKPLFDKVRQAQTAIRSVVSPNPISGQATASPSETTVYTLTATRSLPVFPSTRTVNVRVNPNVPPSIASFVAAPERINHEGESVQLTWQFAGLPAKKLKLVASAPGAGVVNEQVVDGVPLSNMVTIQPWFDNETYEIQVYGDDATTPTGQAAVHIGINEPLIVSFTADPLVTGNPVTLRWQADNATTTEIVQMPDPTQTIDVNGLLAAVHAGDPNVPVQTVPSGYNEWTTSKPLEVSTLFLLVAHNQGGSRFKVLRVVVKPTIVDFRADPTIVTKGAATTLSWTLSGPAARAVTIDPLGPVDAGLTGAAVVPQQTTTYTLSAVDQFGQQADPKTVTVVVAPPATKVDYFLATPGTIAPGQPSQLNYSAQNATRITIKSADGKVIFDQPAANRPVLQGSVPVSPTATTTYVLDAAGKDPASMIVVPVTITVQPPTQTPAPSATPPPAGTPTKATTPAPAR